MLSLCMPRHNYFETALIFHLVASVFFNFMSILVEMVPLGAFSSRESEMGWIKQGSHLTPIVLSAVVREQCKILLVDSFTRELFNIATDPDAIGTDSILRKKIANDVKLEKELHDIRAISAVGVAAKEAMIDRSTGFWQSKWAKQLSKKVVSFILYCCTFVILMESTQL